MFGTFDPQEIKQLSFSVTQKAEELVLKTEKVLYIGFFLGLSLIKSSSPLTGFPYAPEVKVSLLGEQMVMA